MASTRLLHTKRWSSRDHQCWEAAFPAAAQSAVGGPGMVSARSDCRHSKKADNTTRVQLYYSASCRTPPSVKTAAKQALLYYRLSYPKGVDSSRRHGFFPPKEGIVHRAKKCCNLPLSGCLLKEDGLPTVLGLFRNVRRVCLLSRTVRLRLHALCRPKGGHDKK